VQPDGSHLADKWNKFMQWHGDPALVQRLVSDVFSAGLTSEFGHFAVADYQMEDRLPLVSCPGLLIYGIRDAFANQAQAAPFRAALRPVREVVIDAGAFLPNESPHAFADAARAFAV
jgi:pimeloyl-ACP methyl ester carboxylesterase